MKPTRWIPTGYQEVARDDALGCIAYAGGQPGRLGVICYGGKRNNPDYHYTFKDPAKLADFVRRWLESQRQHADDQKKRRTERIASPRGLEVGDVIYASWGYDQTNVDYYQVTGLIGEKMVELRKIGAISQQTGFEQGTCRSNPNHFIGDPFRRVARGGSVTIDKVRSASKTSPTESHGWSGYAQSSRATGGKITWKNEVID